MKEIKNLNIFSFKNFNLNIRENDIKIFFYHTSSYKGNLKTLLNKIIIFDNKIDFSSINSYFAAILSSFIRRKIVENDISLSFETVMSSYDKIDFINYVKEKGYKTYLYFIATDYPQINIQRVKNRVILWMS